MLIPWLLLKTQIFAPPTAVGVWLFFILDQYLILISDKDSPNFCNQKLPINEKLDLDQDQKNVVRISLQKLIYFTSKTKGKGKGVSFCMATKGNTTELQTLSMTRQQEKTDKATK